ncbi:30222_t:CDS:2 [Gigaspora margarita]|uniref:30222_t:CDS:1 n=1 Tax=Gigaspora margarita TaxID=4874 RepID=A0ABM8W4J9_GIGMA|nr:30222_t:CDS:2 [Gigaspora margarita]
MDEAAKRKHWSTPITLLKQKSTKSNEVIKVNQNQEDQEEEYATP